MSAYCQQAVSAATRASLLTGMCPDRTRVWDLKTLIRSQNPDVVTLPQYFKENGYRVAGIGKIYDPRSVDKQQDARSWSEEYMEHAQFINAGFEQPSKGLRSSTAMNNTFFRDSCVSSITVCAFITRGRQVLAKAETATE